jgi:hypothetical protein
MMDKKEEILGGQHERKIPTERNYEKEKEKKDNIYIIERERASMWLSLRHDVSAWQNI